MRKVDLDHAGEKITKVGMIVAAVGAIPLLAFNPMGSWIAPLVIVVLATIGAHLGLSAETMSDWFNQGAYSLFVLTIVGSLIILLGFNARRFPRLIEAIHWLFSDWHVPFRSPK